MSNHRIRSFKWLAPAAMVGAVGLAACGSDGSPETVDLSSRNPAAQAHEAERYVELQKDGESHACKWISVGAPPTPDAVAVLETCAGEWTGNMEWVQPRSSHSKGEGSSNLRVAYSWVDHPLGCVPRHMRSVTRDVE
jgi:hypothetical protein